MPLRLYVGYEMTDKKTEALKLALEALEMHVPHVYKDRGYSPIIAIREALAEQPAQQEPVACKTLCELCVKRGYHFCANAAQTTPIPSPPASKPWVGLDDADLDVCDTDGRLLARYWERVLREKNT